MFTIDYSKNVNLSFHSNILPVNIIHKYIIVYNRNNTLYIELQSIMNERDKSDLRQVDNQIYHELNQPAGERDVEVYNELSRPGERNRRYYDEVNNIGQSYYQELRLGQPAEHTIYHACNQRSSPKQVSIDNKLQLVTKMVIFLTAVLLIIMLFLLIISNVLTAVIFTTLNNLKGTSTSTAGVVDDILLVVEELLEKQNASVLFNSIRPVSCKDIKTVLPNSPTGYYHVNSHNIYCNMGELCGTGGGWTRLAYLDMSDSTVNCPTAFRLYQSGGVRACGRPVSSGGNCSSVQYPSNGISYSQICGKVVGYQYGSPNAVETHQGYINNINSYYVDGVSITCGSPRQHVWTLMAGLFDSHNNCPCNTPPGGTQQVQSFVGSNYFCESGNPDDTWTRTLYTKDPLWDGKGCGTNETICCSAPGLPWFHRDYGNVTTTDYIELRVCGDQPTTNEDVPVSFYEIYVN